MIRNDDGDVYYDAERWNNEREGIIKQREWNGRTMEQKMMVKTDAYYDDAINIMILSRPS